MEPGLPWERCRTLILAVGLIQPITVEVHGQTAPAPEFVLVPAADVEPGGPTHDFRISRFEITNEQFVDFLNDALSNPQNERGSFLYFDVSTGDVYVNTRQAGQTGSGPLGRSVRIFSPSPASQIEFSGGAYHVIAAPVDYAKHPVTGVTWYGAVKYCNWLTVATGLPADLRVYTEGSADDLSQWRPATISAADWATRDLNTTERVALLDLFGFRLPMDGGGVGAGSFNEWHKAASARLVGNAVTFDAVFGFGRDVILPADANDDNSNDPFEPGTTPVGFYDGVNTLADGTITADTDNAYGLYDLSGNVWEWLQDQSTTDPTRRRARGGSWRSLPAVLTVTASAGRGALTGDEATGFRAVQTVVRDLMVTPADSLIAGGVWGGPYDDPLATRVVYRVTNLVDTPIILGASADDPWVSVQPASATIEAGGSVDVTVSLDPACVDGLTVGANETAVHFADGNGAEVGIRAVRLNVTEPLGVTPTTSFDAVMPVGGQPAPPNTFFFLQNASNQLISWSATWRETTVPPTGLSWLTVDPGGEVPPRGGLASLNVDIDTVVASMLPPGVYTAEVVITDDCTGAQFVRPVRLTVSVPFTVAPEADGAASGVTGGPLDPMSFAYSVVNQQNDFIDWTVSLCTEAPNAATCTAPAAPFWLALDAAGGTLLPNDAFPLTASLTATALTLDANTYTVTLRFQQPGTGYSVDRKVTLDVTGLQVEPTVNVEFEGPLGGPFAPARMTYTIVNTGLPELNWVASVSHDPPLTALNGLNWLDVSPLSGVILDINGREDAIVSLTSDAALLAAGRYDATITFSANGARSVRNVTLIVGGESFSLEMVTVPGADAQPGGPAYDFRIGRFEVTHEEYARFLNAALRNARGNAPDAQSEFLYFDVDSGDVYVNDARPAAVGTDAPSLTLTTRLFDAAVNGAISYDGFKYVVVDAKKRFPVSGVSWYGAVKFCNWLTLVQGMSEDQRAYTEAASPQGWHPVSIGTADWMVRDLNFAEREALLLVRGFRLPLDDQAAAAGAHNEWYKAAAWLNGPAVNAFYGFGRDTMTGADANYRDSGDPEEPGPTPVGFYNGVNNLSSGDRTIDTGNGYGLYDMTGNVAEWVQGRDPVTLETTTRGGHFNSSSSSPLLRGDGRGTAPADAVTSFLGFRVAQVIEPVELTTSQDVVRVTGFVGGPYDRDRVHLMIQNNGAQAIDTLTLSVDAGWLSVEGVAPTLVSPGTTITVPFTITATVDGPGPSPAPAGDFALVAADDLQPGGVDYDYWIGRTEITNGQFAAFLNDALADARGATPGARSDFLYFDLDSGDVYINDKPSGEEGAVAPDATRTTLIYDASMGRIDLTGDVFTVVAGFENHPVVGVSWFGAVKYANWLSLSQGLPPALRAYEEAPGTDLTGWHPVVVDETTWTGGPMPASARRFLVEDTLGFRLPMDDEADGASLFNEWFKAAARAGLDRSGAVQFGAVYGFGRDRLENIDANFLDSGAAENNGTTPVRFFNGQNTLFQQPTTCFPPLPGPPRTKDTDNGYGLHDACGNVAEWVQDFVDGDVSMRATRGGSWRDPRAALELTTTGRAALRPEEVRDDTGFRLVRGTGHVATVTVGEAFSNELRRNFFILDLREPFRVDPRTDLSSQRVYGETLTGTQTTYALTNRSDSDMNWVVTVDRTWAEASAIGTGETTGTITGGGTLDLVLTTNASADALAPGTYQATLSLQNTTTGGLFQRHLDLTVDQPVSVTTSNAQALTFVGIWSGPFASLPSQALTLTSLVGFDLDYAVITTATWLQAEPLNAADPLAGTLTGLQSIPLAVSLTNEADALAPGTYDANVQITITDRANGDLTWTADQSVVLSVQEPVDIAQSVDPWRVGPNPDPSVWPPQTYSVTNLSTSPIEVAITTDVDWLTISDPLVEVFAGTSQTRDVTVSLNDNVLSLFDGDYTAAITFENTVTGLAQCRTVELSIVETLSVAPFRDYVAYGAIGNEVSPPLQLYRLTNVARDAGGPIDWSASVLAPGADWIRLNGAAAAGGTLADGESANVIVTLDTTGLPAGAYAAEMAFAVLPGGETVMRSVALTLVQPAFEVRENLVPAAARQPLGPAYDFSMNTFQTTNAQFAAFLNDAMSNLTTGRGEYLFFDSTTGDVYLNSSRTGEIGAAAPAGGVPLFVPSIAGGIERVGGAYRVVTTPIDLSDHPVAGVSWYGAVKYANWLTLDQGMPPSERCYTEGTDADPSAWHPVSIGTTDWALRDLTPDERERLVTGCRGFRLPMDQGFNNNPLSIDSADAYNEWYKASAWNDALRRPTVFGFGRDVLSGGDANYLGSGDPFDDGTTPVAYYDGLIKGSAFVTRASANGFGLFDMCGNVYQWLQGRFSAHAGGIDFRTIRGGSWKQPADSPDLRADARNFAPAELTDAQVGFRLLRTPPPTPADVNADGVVDATDHLVIAACWDGPSLPVRPGCLSLDLAADAHVDLKDFARFQIAFTGSP